MRPSRLLAIILSSPVCGGVTGPLVVKRPAYCHLEDNVQPFFTESNFNTLIKRSRLAAGVGTFNHEWLADTKDMAQCKTTN